MPPKPYVAIGVPVSCQKGYQKRGGLKRVAGPTYQTTLQHPYFCLFEYTQLLHLATSIYTCNVLAPTFLELIWRAVEGFKARSFSCVMGGWIRLVQNSARAAPGRTTHKRQQWREWLLAVLPRRK